MPDIRYAFERDNRRAAAYDGDKLAGSSTISPSPTTWIIDHTEVNPAYSGQGIGRVLVKLIVDAAREAKVKVLPLCPYAKKEFDKNPAYQDLL